MMKADLLLIDDDKLFLMLNRQQIINSKFHNNPQTFLSGELAINWLNQNALEDKNILIFLDLNMPDINGWQFLDILVEKNYPATIKVALVTSSTDPADKLKAETYSYVFAYLEKPMKQSELLKLNTHPALQLFF